MRKETSQVPERSEGNASGEEEHHSIIVRVPRFPKIYLDGRLMMDGSPFMCLFGHLDYAKNCPNCGGIPVELELVHEGRRYLFTCYEIVSRTGKVVSETDYDKLAEYLMTRKDFLSRKRKCARA